jgi:hypothetical protein
VTAEVTLPSTVGVKLAGIDMDGPGSHWSALPGANEPTRPGRVYRLLTHPGAAPDLGEPVALEWLRSLLDEHDAAAVDVTRASGRVAA